MELDPDDDCAEVEIHIEPRIEKLEELGVTAEQFDAALDQALDAFHERLHAAEDPADLSPDETLDEVPPLDDIPIELNGRNYRLSDVAEILVSGDVPEE